ncbi:MAG: hypothetical protein KZQ73_06625 [Candidatus Thiodiazotropha sp. (ex Semelilucina semeliformis)]|nr:hypothetical protein [Candidatus Thiodiazotropha sp. (ex Semelilucina semeliformis)]MCU7828522.1 hypothetical protein [Candidatus Thiodiazotropha sp. (ex Myrtea sp. 'scaly one' KF741663)]
MMRYALLLPFLFLILTGCDAMQDFKQMGEKQSRVQTYIKDKYGWHAEIGWNIHNAELTQVTLVLSADEVANERVETLQAIAKETVGEVFVSTPKAIYVTLVTTMDDG